MTQRVTRAGLQVDKILADFIETKALIGSGVGADDFWAGLSDLAVTQGAKNRALLAKRDALQTQIDNWHIAHRNAPHDPAAYKAFLQEIGYLLPEGEDFQIDTANVDPEIASIPGPQLVVPITNARYALNAANARWGSLYDAFYGTDAMGSAALQAAMTRAAVPVLLPARGCFWTRPFRLPVQAMPMYAAIMCKTARF